MVQLKNRIRNKKTNNLIVEFLQKINIFEWEHQHSVKLKSLRFAAASPKEVSWNQVPHFTHYCMSDWSSVSHTMQNQLPDFFLRLPPICFVVVNPDVK